jgi:hypothetical protein
MEGAVRSGDAATAAIVADRAGAPREGAAV